MAIQKYHKIPEAYYCRALVKYYNEDDKGVIEDCSKVMQPWDLNNVQQTLSKPSNPAEVEKFKEYTQWLDNSRKENFAETFPELYKVL